MNNDELILSGCSRHCSEYTPVFYPFSSDRVLGRGSDDGL